jgi:hypothetical protein
VRVLTVVTWYRSLPGEYTVARCAGAMDVTNALADTIIASWRAKFEDMQTPGAVRDAAATVRPLETSS